MKIQGNQFLSIEQLQDQYLKTGRQQAGAPKPNTTSFQDILSGKTDSIRTEGEVRFSKHAANRLNDRNIELTKDQVERLNMGAAKAGAKGINESLVIVDSLAFIVNVPNQTVITAMDQTETDENVFTNIDGAVII
ncbi:MAG: flagellar protein [Lachnospiraceae bacterium]|nr:flagellar protein [Lachnospiraceae bacterium]MBD5485093.1 flagellar protein [Lachnospiraceae bacterium]MBD5505834.1 flagellar protein [Lachnospiraceae bacterium]MBD5513471.1 flagellar protein [Lachnospiraceae bacterium]